MLFQRIKRDDPEQIFTVVYNVSAATVTAGYPVVFDTSTADGVRVTKPATAVFSLLVGLAAEDIADSSYGKVQVYGYRSSGYVTNGTAGGTDIAAGDLLVVTNAQWYLSRSAAGNATTSGGHGIVAGEAFATATTPAAANKKVFIKCLGV